MAGWIAICSYRSVDKIELDAFSLNNLRLNIARYCDKIYEYCVCLLKKGEGAQNSVWPSILNSTLI